MKTTLMLAMLSLAALTGFAQSGPDANPPKLKNNGPKVFVRPNFDRPFRVLFNPPCVEYKRHGVVVLECPGIMMAPEVGDYDKSQYPGYGYGNTVQNPSTDNINWKKENEDNNSLSKK